MYSIVIIDIITYPESWQCFPNIFAHLKSNLVEPLFFIRPGLKVHGKENRGRKGTDAILYVEATAQSSCRKIEEEFEMISERRVTFCQ